MIKVVQDKELDLVVRRFCKNAGLSHVDALKIVATSLKLLVSYLEYMEVTQDEVLEELFENKKARRHASDHITVALSLLDDIDAMLDKRE